MIEEQGVRLKLTITDTPGFGDKINNEKWWASQEDLEGGGGGGGEIESGGGIERK